MAGGAVLASDLNSIRVGCSDLVGHDMMVFMNRSQFESLVVLNSRESVCPSWKRNKAGIYGETLATYLHQIQKLVWNDHEDDGVRTAGNSYIAMTHTRGTPIPTVSFTALDSLGQGPAVTNNNESIEVVFRSPDGLFPGVASFLLRGGSGSSPNIIGSAAPGIYTAVANFSAKNILPFVMKIRIRGCIVGESALRNGTVCRPCPTEMYNLHPNEVNRACVPCPHNAVCDAAFIRPAKGHWHMTPCSSELQKCLSATACDYEERDANLIKLTLSHTDCNFSQFFVQNYGVGQCRKVSPESSPVECEFWNQV